MPTVVGIRLRNASRTLTFDAAGTEPAPGDAVIVRTERGEEFGEAVTPPHEPAEGEVVAALKPVVRVATEDDVRCAEELRQREQDAMPVYRDLVKQHKLDMKPIDVEYLFDGSKIVFYFVAEDRVDFRDLVRDLATRFKARIDMRQVGVRDEARMVGGLGHCGEQLCCVRFGGEFQPVSIRMAKEQDLPLNPLKISGLCGRLMCCLRYEYDAYKDFKSRAPKKGAIISTPDGPGKVSELNTPKETVTFRMEGGTSVTVPVGKMECCKGEGCPCSVSRETLDEVSGRSLESLEAVMQAAPAAQAVKTSEAPAAERPKRSRRRGKGGGAAAEGEQPKQQQPKQAQDKQPQQRRKKPATAPTTEGQEPSAIPGRRRRRRRPGTASGGGE